MELNFLVGEREQHHVYFSWNQMWGGLKIAVDGIDVVKTVSLRISAPNHHRLGGRPAGCWRSFHDLAAISVGRLVLAGESG